MQAAHGGDEDDQGTLNKMHTISQRGYRTPKPIAKRPYMTTAPTPALNLQASTRVREVKFYLTSAMKSLVMN